MRALLVAAIYLFIVNFLYMFCKLLRWSTLLQAIFFQKFNLYLFALIIFPLCYNFTVMLISFALFHQQLRKQCFHVIQHDITVTRTDISLKIQKVTYTFQTVTCISQKLHSFQKPSCPCCQFTSDFETPSCCVASRLILLAFHGINQKR